MESYCEHQQKADEEAFSGADSQSSGSAGFTGRTALPHVMYDDRCQGRRPGYTLISAVYGHFLTIAEHLNTEVLLAELRETDFRIEQPCMVFEFDLKSTHSLIDALIQTVNASRQIAAEKLAQGPTVAAGVAMDSAEGLRAAYALALKGAEEFDCKPVVEQEAIKAKSQAALIDRLLADLKGPREDSRRTQLDAVCGQALFPSEPQNAPTAPRRRSGP